MRKTTKKTKKKKVTRGKKQIKGFEKTMMVVEETAKVPVDVRVTEKDIDDFLFGSQTNLTQQQKTLFKQTAIMFNLNPFKREVYAVAYGSEFNIITGYEVYIKRANRVKVLDGWVPECSGTGKDLTAKVTIHRKDWQHPFVHEVYFAECCQYRKDGQATKFWSKMPRLMLKKVCISQAFRLCFPEEFAGMPYTADEMPLKDADYKVNEIETKPQKEIELDKTPETPQVTVLDDLDKKIKEATGVLGWENKKLMDYIKFQFKVDKYKAMDATMKLKLYEMLSKTIDEGAKNGV